MSLADEIIVMDHGRILQQGNAAAIYHAPRTRTVAEFIGRTNWFEGKSEGPSRPCCANF